MLDKYWSRMFVCNVNLAKSVRLSVLNRRDEMKG